MTDLPQATFKPDEAVSRALVARTTFEKEAVWLPLLAVHHWNAGEMAVRGKTFTDCVVEGPAVLAVLSGTTFDSCAMGTTTDTANLLYKPQGRKLAGVVGMADCTFVRCRFVQVGFTGSDELLEDLMANIRSGAGGGGSEPTS
jgi:hypothetical protein